MTITNIESSGTLDDESGLTSRLRELFKLAKDQKRKYQAAWRRNYLLTTNRMNAADTQQPWSPNITDSEVFPILSSRIAWMTDQRIEPEIAPAATENSPFYQYMQKLGEQLQSLIRSIGAVNAWDQQIVLSLWDAGQFGAGIFKSCWDSGLTTGLGNAVLRRIDPWKFYPDPHATSFDDCNYMFEVNRMTITEIQRKFPGAAERLIDAITMTGDTSSDNLIRPGPNSSGQYPMAMPGNLPTSASTIWGLSGVNVSAESVLTEGVNVYECWVRENQDEERQATDPLHDSPESVVTDKWRVIVFSNSVVLLDEYAEDLWEYDRHPYTRYVDEETGEFWPVPLVSHLAPAQIAINRLLSAMQGNAELVGNPIFMDTANSGLARTQIVNRPGVRLTLDHAAANGQGVKPDWLRPPDMSQLVPNLVQYWLARMENISGITGVQRGHTPSGRQAQQTIQATQEAASVRIRSSLRNLERALAKAYQLIADLVIQNYTIPRVVAIIGPDGNDAALRLAARHFYSPTPRGAEPMRFSLVVRAGSSNPTSRQARIAEADALFAMHAIDTTAVLEAHAFPNWQSVAKRVEQKAQAQEKMQMEMHERPHGKGTGHEH